MTASDMLRNILIDQWSVQLNVALFELTFEYASNLLKDLSNFEVSNVLTE